MTAAALPLLGALLTRKGWRAGLTVAALIAFVFAVYVWLRTPRPLNVLLITLDTTRADRLGCYGHEAALTPVLDRLARNGVLFEKAYTPVPLTLPAHASILTGLQPPEHGLHVNGQGSLPESIPTLATKLEAAGYETGAFVAAFVLDSKFGLTRGFGTYDDDLSGADEELDGHHRYRPAATVIDSALDWLRPRADEPSFCWIHLFDPHYPYLDHADRFGDRFSEQPYDAELAYVDQELGRLFDALSKFGTLDRTMIVIVGDHGESLGEHGERAHGMTLYDATLHVPLLVSLPRKGTKGHRVQEPVALVDVCPTVLECLALDPIPKTSGGSLLSALRGEALPVEPCFAETDEPYQTARWSPLRALISGEWKYIRSTKPELYDLRDDPKELTNLAAQQPDRLQEMERTLGEWEARMHRRLAEDAGITEQDRRILSSLGYAAQRPPDSGSEEALPDVKDMLPYYNMLNDASEMMEAGRHDLAEPLLRKILAADERFFLAHGDLAKCLIRRNELDEAIVHLRRNLELDPGADPVRGLLGAALLLGGQHEEAALELQKAIQSSPDLIEVRFNLAYALENLGRIEEAIQQYQACLEQRPDLEQARERLSGLLRRQ